MWCLPQSVSSKVPAKKLIFTSLPKHTVVWLKFTVREKKGLEISITILLTTAIWSVLKRMGVFGKYYIFNIKRIKTPLYRVNKQTENYKFPLIRFLIIKTTMKTLRYTFKLGSSYLELL